MAVHTMKLRQEYLVSYDIENTKTRTKVFNELRSTGLKPVQKSVFWGYLTNAELRSLHRYIKEAISVDDRALITRTNFNSVGSSFLIGHDSEQFRDWEPCSVI